MSIENLYHSIGGTFRCNIVTVNRINGNPILRSWRGRERIPHPVDTVACVAAWLFNLAAASNSSASCESIESGCDIAQVA